jgi:F0F1-type ATP synthase assembly protein I
VSGEKPLSRALGEGPVDAAGFVGGALLGWLLGRWLGFDFMNEAGYGPRVLVGIVLVGVGGGLGVQLLRRFAAHAAGRKHDDKR